MRIAVMGGKNKSSAARSGGRPKPSKASGSDNKLLYAVVALGVALVAVGLQASGVLPAFALSSAAVQQHPPRDTLATASSTRHERPPKKAPKAAQKKQPPPVPIDPSCVDDDPNCEQWARSGECERNRAYMERSCRASCHVCASNKPKPKPVEECEDRNANCATWAAIGERSLAHRTGLHRRRPPPTHPRTPRLPTLPHPPLLEPVRA